MVIISRRHITCTRDIKNAYKVLFGISEPLGNEMGECTRGTSCKESGVLSSNYVYIGESPTLRRNISPPSSGPNSKPNNKPAEANGKLRLTGIIHVRKFLNTPSVAR
jgi:hypothetical protein